MESQTQNTELADYIIASDLFSGYLTIVDLLNYKLLIFC